MLFSDRWNRRSFLGGIGAMMGAAFGGSTFVSEAAAAAKSRVVSGFGATGNVYEELGVTTVINGQGTMTYLGGSLMRPEIDAVMAQGAKHFVRIVALEEAAGKRIAQMLKLPAGYTAIVTSGAAAAIQSGLAGVLTRDNEQLIRQLPDLTGMKSEVIIQKSHRNAFDHQLRGTGAKLAVVETRDELLQAINPQTAMMHFTNFANDAGQIKVEEFVKIAHDHELPAFIDAAADTPPVSHLWDYANMGYDLIAFSGGKAMRGPQCAGLLLGKEDLVRYALMNNSPNEDTLGRGQKIGKEEIVGMIKALELYLKEDHQAEAKEWQRRLDYISGQVTRIPGVATSFFVPAIANHVPHMEIAWDTAKISATPQDIQKELAEGKPSIILIAGEEGRGLSMNSFMLKNGEERIVAEHLHKALKSRAV